MYLSQSNATSGVAMSKETRGRPKQHKDLVALTVRLERTMMDDLDGFIDRLQQERGGFPVNRVDVVRVASLGGGWTLYGDPFFSEGSFFQAMTK